jgi:hypothetical protein
VKVGCGVKLEVGEGGIKPVGDKVGVKVSVGIAVLVAEGIRYGVLDGSSSLGVGVSVIVGARRIAMIPAQ